MKYRVLAPEDFPVSAQTPSGLAAYLEQSEQDGWRFVSVRGRLAVFRCETPVAGLFTPASRVVGNLVDDE